MKLLPTLCTAALALSLAACNADNREAREPAAKAVAKASAWTGDGMTSHDDGRDTATDDKPRPEMQLQVVLDRLGFSPGVIDGKTGLSTGNALKGFQEANDLDVTGEWDAATKDVLSRWQSIPATRVVTIPASYGDLVLQPLPNAASEQSKLGKLDYESMLEKLAERFHTTPEVLKEINPATVFPDAEATDAVTAKIGGADSTPPVAPPFGPGSTLRVPNIGADHIVAAKVEDANWLATLASLGVGTEQAEAKRIEVSKKAGTMKAFGADDKLIAIFTVTTGSRRDPLPIGNWKVTGVARNPDFAYNPDLLWDVPDSAAKLRLPPGPNGPVGVVWIDLDKEHYGLHGTPEPQTIGRADSHGCVRLTNWDAARLAQMVAVGTVVDFIA